MPPLWLLALLFSGAIGVEVLRAYELLAPVAQGACVFLIAGVGAAIVGRTHAERAILFPPCLWIIGSVVLGFVALEQWYTQDPQQRGFYDWISEGFQGDWSFLGLLMGRAAGGGSQSLSYLLVLPVLTVPGALGFAALRKRELPDQTLRNLPPSTSFKFFGFVVAAFALASLQMLLPIYGALLITVRPAAHFPGTDWAKHARSAGLFCALLFGALLALLAMNMFSSFGYELAELHARAQQRILAQRALCIVFALEALLVLLALVGSRLARRGAVILAALFPALSLGYALSSGDGLLDFQTKLIGFAAVLLAYLPLSKKDLAAPEASASALAASSDIVG